MTQNLTVSLQNGNWASVAVNAVDSGSNPQAIHGAVTIDDYSKAYCYGNAGGFGIVPKLAAPQGGSYQVTATFQAFSQDGTALDPVTLTATVSGPPVTPQATALLLGSPVVQPSIDTLHGTPDDPGGAQVTF